MDKKKFTISFLFFLTIAGILTLVLMHYSATSIMLNPKGLIAIRERDLMVTSTLLMLIIVIPVLVLTFYICLKYRASNRAANYNPNWNDSLIAETIWWGAPCIIIIVLSIITWQSSRELDPFKPLQSDVKPIEVQVIALQWKWLFIYPEHNIASINFFQVPDNTPINFEVTADAPMNSFWLPQLGGQIYAMPGMRTKIHMIADKPGEYRGSSANLSGAGFAGMVFTAKATSQKEFEEWVKEAQNSKNVLDAKSYEGLVAPSSYNPVEVLSLEDNGLFDQVIMKYMMPKDNESEKVEHNKDT